jgi:3-methylcrotonyl-CoA carboxylase beta subunit
MKIVSSVATHSDLFVENVDAYQELVSTLEARQQWVIDGDRQRSIDRHHARGKILVRDRIDMVTDESTSFLEFSTLAGYGMYDDAFPGGGIVTGVGVVRGLPCVFIANDATVKGGSLSPISIKKHVRAQDIALEHRLPTIYLVDSGGAFLPLQDEIFPDRDHFGGSFYRQARMSSAGIPQISVVLGGCTAGGAYVPALSDEVIIVKGIGRIFLGGPPIVKAALNEIVDPDELGGAEMHTKVSGVADHLANTEGEAYAMLREIVGNLNEKSVDFLEGWSDKVDPVDPAYPASEIYGILNHDTRIPFDVKEVIARLVDASDFSEFKPGYGSSVVTGFARIWGHRVGIVGNNGIIFSESALKATHFIEMCNQRDIPLLFLQNTTGYMVGKDSEAGGIAKDGAKMVNAVANSTVPKYTVLIGGSYGAGNYGMCGRGFDPRFLFAWPNSRIATMAPKTAETVLSDIRLGGLKGVETSQEQVDQIKTEIREQFMKQSDPYHATARLWDDGLIDPINTRDVLGLCLSLATRQPSEPSQARVFRM